VIFIAVLAQCNMAEVRKRFAVNSRTLESKAFLKTRSKLADPISRRTVKVYT
jgi:hypothetical protein